MRARYPLALALVVLLALVPPAVASEAARAPTAQAGQLWLLVLEPTAAFAPGADEPAWVAEPGEWYWVVNRNAARDRTGTSLWALAVWEFDPPSAAVLIRLDERVQQFLGPAPPPPPTPAPAAGRAVVESRIQVDTPQNGEFTLSNLIATYGDGKGSTVRVQGWAVDPRAVGWAGFDNVHFYLDAPAGTGRPPVAAGWFYSRPDVAANFNRPDWRDSGFWVDIDHVAPGPHTLYVYPFYSGSADRPVKTVSFTACRREYLPGYEPGGVWEQIDNRLGITFTPRTWVNCGDPVTVAPPQPPRTRPPAPSDSDFVVTVLSIDGLIRSFPTVHGRACNRATRWKATGIRIEFAFYDTGLLPTLDSGSHYISEVGSGECRSFTASLIALRPWRTIVIDRVSWTWELER